MAVLSDGKWITVREQGKMPQTPPAWLATIWKTPIPRHKIQSWGKTELHHSMAVKSVFTSNIIVGNLLESNDAGPGE